MADEGKHRYENMLGCVGYTYAEAKVQLLRQFCIDVDVSIFDGMTETQIDNKARSLIMNR